MKDTVVINGVTLTRAQVEEAMKELNAPGPGNIVVNYDLRLNGQVVIERRNLGYLRGRAYFLRTDGGIKWRLETDPDDRFATLLVPERL